MTGSLAAIAAPSGIDWGAFQQMVPTTGAFSMPAMSYANPAPSGFGFGNSAWSQSNFGPAPDMAFGAPQTAANAPTGSGFGFNLGTMGMAIQGIGALTNAYLGYQQLKQAKEALGLQREAFNANLNNSIQTYNTSLEDRIRGRTSAYEGKENDVQAYLAKHSLKR